jgi:MFS family permease
VPTLRTPIRVRWWIFLYTFLFAMLTYLQRNSLSIAAVRIMPELHLSQMQVGWLMETFTVAYMLLQLPGGVLGERIGARAAYIAVGVIGGERGIRTLEGLLTLTPLAGVRLRPLGHLSAQLKIAA